MTTWMSPARLTLLAAGLVFGVTACDDRQVADSETPFIEAAAAPTNTEKVFFEDLLSTPFAGPADAAAEPVDFAIAFADLPASEPPQLHLVGQESVRMRTIVIQFGKIAYVGSILSFSIPRHSDDLSGDK